MGKKSVKRDLSALWAGRTCKKFYATARNTFKDLYASEKVFLPRILKKSMRVLDVGCASGGFSRIMREIEPSIIYCGCDFSAELIKVAKKYHPGVDFVVADGAKLPFKSNMFDLVHSAGTCHMIPKYLKTISEMYRASKKFCVFDVRLTDVKTVSDEIKCYQKLCFDDKWDGTSKSPYIVLNGEYFLETLLARLEPKPKAIFVTGYVKSPADTVVSPLKEICMAVFMIEKGSKGFKGETEILLDIPYAFRKINGAKIKKSKGSAELISIINKKMENY